MAIQQATNWQGDSYYWDDSTGAIVSNEDAQQQLQQQQAITPESATIAYQQVTGTAPPPGWAEQTVAAYSSDPTANIQNVVRDTATAALQNGTPVNIEYTPSAWTQGWAEPTGQPQVINDYQGQPTIKVDGNGNVVAWRGTSGQIWTPQSYNQAYAQGQVDPRQIDSAPLRNPDRTPFIQDLLKGLLYVGGAALTAGLGSGIASSIGTALGATGEAAKTVGMAVLNAARSGASAALSNQNPLIAALNAGINPFVSGGISQLLQGVDIPSEIANRIGSTTSGFTSGYGGALAAGKTGADALRAGEMGAISSIEGQARQGLIDSLGLGTFTDEQARQFMEEDTLPADYESGKLLSDVLQNVGSLAQKTIIDPKIAQLLGVQTQTTADQAGPSGAPGTSKPPTATTRIATPTSKSTRAASQAGQSGTTGTSGGIGQTPGQGSGVTIYWSGAPDQLGATDTATQGATGTQALAQALRVGDPGAAIESPDQGTGTQKNVWNQASLRVKDETGSEQ
jgi:hypothetical protein